MLKLIGRDKTDKPLLYARAWQANKALFAL